MEEGRSGNEVPSEFGNPSRYHSKAAAVALPAILISILLGVAAVHLGGETRRLCYKLELLGAAFSFGSNAWLLIYGPKMYKVCTSTQWLGKEGFSTIQAALFPDYFAFQTASCVLALCAHIGIVQTCDLAATAVAVALGLGLVNLCVLGPATNAMMVQLYMTPLMDDAVKGAKKKFGMIHGISMLADVFALAAVAAFICLVSAQ